MRHIQALPDESSLIPLVGNQARRIWELANGIDDRPVETDRKIQSIGAEETYEEDLTDGSTIELEFRYFANRLSKRLRKRNLLGHTVSIKVRYDDFTTVSRQKRLDTPSDHEHVSSKLRCSFGTSSCKIRRARNLKEKQKSLNP